MKLFNKISFTVLFGLLSTLLAQAAAQEDFAQHNGKVFYRLTTGRDAYNENIPLTLWLSTDCSEGLHSLNPDQIFYVANPFQTQESLERFTKWAAPLIQNMHFVSKTDQERLLNLSIANARKIE